MCRGETLLLPIRCQDYKSHFSFLIILCFCGIRRTLCRSYSIIFFVLTALFSTPSPHPDTFYLTPTQTLTHTSLEYKLNKEAKMEPALPLPLRLNLTHSPVPTSHDQVSTSISNFLSSYAARTGTQNAASSDDPSSSASGSTGGVVAAQLTRLMNGLSGKIDLDLFNLFPSTTSITNTAEEIDQETPTQVLAAIESSETEGGDGKGKESFSKTDELRIAETPNIDDSLRTNPMEEESPRKKSKKEKKDKTERKKVKSEA